MIRPFVLAAAALCLGAASVVGWPQSDADAGGAANTAAATDPAPTGALPHGATVFRVKGCASCHAGPGTVPQYSFDYPDLTRAATWAGTRRPGLSAGDYVRESIRTPEAFLSPVFRGGGPSPMPALSLTDREVDALLAYLLNP